MARVATPLLALVMLIGLSGCYRTYYYVGQPGVPGSGKGKWHHGWLFGLIEQEPVNIEERCPGGEFTGFYVHRSFLAGLVNYAQNIYTPMVVNIECGKPGKRDVEPDGSVANPPALDLALESGL